MVEVRCLGLESDLDWVQFWISWFRFCGQIKVRILDKCP